MSDEDYSEDEKERNDYDDLKDWLKKNRIMDIEIYEKLDSEGLEYMPYDLKNVSEKKWLRIKRELTVSRFKENNHDIKSRKAMADRLNFIEKQWRKESGIKTTSLQTNNDGSIKQQSNEYKSGKNSKNRYSKKIGGKSIKKDENNGNGNGSQSQKNKKKEKIKDVSLKDWLRKEDLYDNEIYMILNDEYGMKNMPKDLKKINSNAKWDEIQRRLVVERFKQINHDQKARQRLSDKVTKLEKIWRKVSGIKKTSIMDNNTSKKKSTKKKSSTKKKTSTKTKTKKQTKSKKKTNIKPSNVKKKEKKMDALKPWMQKQQCWIPTLYNVLKKKGIKSPKDLKTLDEKKFDRIVNAVRVARFKELKDQNSRNRCDKMLMNFEKKWRKLSGNKKSNLRSYE